MFVLVAIEVLEFDLQLQGVHGVEDTCFNFGFRIKRSFGGLVIVVARALERRLIWLLLLQMNLMGLVMDTICWNVFKWNVNWRIANMT
jgi:hypothetical protein